MNAYRNTHLSYEYGDRYDRKPGPIFCQLQAQWLTGIYLFGAGKQTSIGELLLPRIELHFVYVTVVLVPTMVSVYLYLRRRAGDIQ